MEKEKCSGGEIRAWCYTCMSMQSSALATTNYREAVEYSIFIYLYSVSHRTARGSTSTNLRHVMDERQKWSDAPARLRRVTAAIN
jgi:hypothetical protein